MTTRNTNTNKTSKKPTHALFHVTDGKDDNKAHWVRIGAAWPHKDGKGMSLQLDLFPRDGRIVLRSIDNEEKGEGR